MIQGEENTKKKAFCLQNSQKYLMSLQFHTRHNVVRGTNYLGVQGEIMQY